MRRPSSLRLALISWHVRRPSSSAPSVGRQYWKGLRSEQPLIRAFDAASQGAIDEFTTTPRKLFDKILNHATEVVNAGSSSPFLLHMDGRAGTGKSHLIEIASTGVDDLFRRHGLKSLILRVARTASRAGRSTRCCGYPSVTGRDAGNGDSLMVLDDVARGGDDLASVVGSSMDVGTHVQLTNAARIEEINKYWGKEWLERGIGDPIIDEKNMMNPPQLSWISARLIQTRPIHSDVPFAGITVILCGDFFQLPPVTPKVLFIGPDASVTKRPSRPHRGPGRYHETAWPRPHCSGLSIGTRPPPHVPSPLQQPA